MQLVKSNLYSFSNFITFRPFNYKLKYTLVRDPSCQLSQEGNVHLSKFEMYVSVRSNKIFGIWPHVNIHTYIHTHASCNAVTLVWGSLRLALARGVCMMVLWPAHLPPHDRVRSGNETMMFTERFIVNSTTKGFKCLFT